MSLRDWDASDIPLCIDCGARVDGSQYGPGVFQCYGCAMGEFEEAQPVPKRLCACGVELQGMSPICAACEQRGVQATKWLLDVDWMQPGYPTEADRKEYEDWLDTLNGETR